jgi:hypothetical protein
MGLLSSVLDNPNFVKWFRKGKVVDDAGEPLRVYHGTNNQFNSFDQRYTKGQMGFHFGDRDAAESIYGDTPPKAVMESYINLQNPLRLDDLGAWQGRDVVDMVNKKLGTKINSSASDSTIRDVILKHGYDGVVYGNKFESGVDGAVKDSYIVFNPTQIKSTANRGTFDPTNPNILKTVGAGLGLMGGAAAFAPSQAQATPWKPPTAESQALQEPTFDPVSLLAPGGLLGNVGGESISALIKYLTGGK